jgi:two-component system cell cycle sensor histidine kinase/response regulator CckA
MANRILRALNVEDLERDVLLLTRHLTRAGYDLVSERVETRAQMKAALEAREWDVILCDYSMPHFSALSALEVLKEMELDIPFIIISGTVGEAVAVEAMRAGANDYLMKDNLVRLAPTIERAIHEADNRRARRRAEAELRRSEVQYRRLLDTAYEGVWVFDDQMRTTYANWRLADMLGVSPEEMIGRSVSDFLDDDARAYVEQRWQQRARGVKEQYDLRLRRADGSALWVIASATPILGEQGEFIGSLSMLTDITERRRAEEALRESEVRYRLLFESNPLPMWVYDLETLAFLAVNEAAIYHYGYSREDFLSMTITDIRPLEDIPALLENVSQIDGGIDAAGGWRHLKKDGTVIDVEITSHELTFAGRRAELVLANDITERKQAEEIQTRRAAQMALRADVNAALAETSSPLRRLLERGTEALVKHLGAALARIWTLNREENVLELRASAGLYTHNDGPDARVPLGATTIGLIAEERQPRITNEVQNDPHLSNKEWAKQEGMVAFAGYPLVVEDRLVGVMAIFARQGLADDTLDALASVADIISQGIERKRAEEALFVTENQLRQSQKLEAVGQLAGGIAHDFNNLLTVITGYSDLLLVHLDQGDPTRLKVEEIKKAGERAASLTRQLLAFSRKQVLQPRVLNLNAIVADTEKMLRRLIGEDVGVLTVLDPSLGQTKADPGQIEQVLLNLTVNARDAMPQGGKLTIETSNVYLDNQYARRHIAVRPGNYVMLAVSDTGSGMNAETQAHIFEPFFTTKEQEKGTGLGLSTVYGIVKQSGGHIWVYSEIEKGTTFKVYLPRVDDVPQIDAAPDTLTDLPLGRETVLLTEDEHPVRHLARVILEMSGYQVLEAAGGDEAISIYEEHKGQIDLLITDVVMPKMSGPELAQSLETLSPGIKVLYLSGYTDDAIIRHGLLDQGMAFLQKPFTPEALTRKVREVLDSTHED